jgi:hypothetical protein
MLFQVSIFQTNNLTIHLQMRYLNVWKHLQKKIVLDGACNCCSYLNESVIANKFFV